MMELNQFFLFGDDYFSFVLPFLVFHPLCGMYGTTSSKAILYGNGAVWIVH